MLRLPHVGAQAAIAGPREPVTVTWAPWVLRAAHPPAWDNAPEPMPQWGRFSQPEPDFEFDQRIAWSWEYRGRIMGI